MAAILKIAKIFMGTPSETILNQPRYLHAKVGAFVLRVTILLKFGPKPPDYRGILLIHMISCQYSNSLASAGESGKFT